MAHAAGQFMGVIWPNTDSMRANVNTRRREMISMSLMGFLEDRKQSDSRTNKELNPQLEQEAIKFSFSCYVCIQFLTEGNRDPTSRYRIHVINRTVVILITHISRDTSKAMG